MGIHRDTAATIWWIVFIAVVIVMAGIFLYPRYQKKNSKYAELRQRREVLEKKQQEREKFSSEIRDLEDSPDAVSRVAREKFGMSRSGETILVYSDPVRSKKEEK